MMLEKFTDAPQCHTAMYDTFMTYMVLKCNVTRSF